jgi:dTDP-4-dehydrorhamnose reductase
MRDGRILVTGGSGQLAQALMQVGAELPLRLAGRPEFDFDRPDTIDTVFADASPALVVNAAAWTAVDLAESQPEAAERANRDGPARLARLCAASGIPLIHISTDYVFDGRKGAPYIEADPTAPTGVYGRTKLAGEQAVMDAGGRAIVLRTSWLYSASGTNFVRTMLAAARRRPHLRVVADQTGCPTAAVDLARAILTVIRVLRDGWQDRYGGVTHAAGTGWTTWYGLANAVFAEAAKHGLPAPTVEPIATAEWPTAAQRPADSRLACRRLEEVFDVRLPEWQASVSETTAQLIRA